MSADPEVTTLAARNAHCDKLRAKEMVSGEVLRRAKAGSEVGLRATHFPVSGTDRKIEKGVKFADVVTKATKTAIEAVAFSSVVKELQAVIEFKSAGTILPTKESFLVALNAGAAAARARGAGRGFAGGVCELRAFGFRSTATATKI